MRLTRKRKALLGTLIAASVLAVVPMSCGSSEARRPNATPAEAAPQPNRFVGIDYQPAPPLPLPFGRPPTAIHVAESKDLAERDVALPSFADGAIRYPWIARAGGFVFVEGIKGDPTSEGNVAFVSADMTARVDLGRAVRIFPAVEPNVVWLWGSDGWIRSVDVTGKVVHQPVMVPLGRNVLGVVSEGAVTTRPDAQQTLELWNFDEARVVRQLDGNGSVRVAPAGFVEDFDRGACASRCARILRPVDGRARLTFEPQMGQAWASSSVSPDGTKFAALSRSTNETGSEVTTTVVVFATNDGQELTRYSLRTWSGKQSLEWAAGSDWLYFTRDSDHVAGFAVSSPDSTAMQFPLSGAASLLVTR